MPINDDYEWVSIKDSVPQHRGHYLVAQKKDRDRCYRFVRFWEGSDWVNPNVENYGNVTHWMKMKPVPF